MKHIHTVTAKAPAKAILPEGHPDLGDSIAGFLANPIGVLVFHVNFLLGKVDQQTT